MAKRQISSQIVTHDVTDVFGVADNERTDGTLRWYYVAKDNLSTAKLLLENKKYHHCVFFLQQCIECIVKGILLENKILKTAESFSHAPESAIEEFYKQLDSGSIDLCEYIKHEMCDKEGFETRLAHMAKVYNLFLEQYYKVLEEDAPEDFYIEPSAYSAIGLPKSCSKNSAYWHVQTMFYVNIFIYCLAILFSNSTNSKLQQNTRYPMEENGLWMPNQKYKETARIIEGLKTIIPQFDFILKTILRE